MKRYVAVCVAGTFDGLHAGHRSLLTKAFAIGSNVLIGLTTDAYVTTFKSGSIGSYETRLAALSAWIAKQEWSDRSRVVPLDDPYGPAVTDASLDALVVSEETEDGGNRVNAKRRENGLEPLAIEVVPMKKAEDLGPISSTRVREGSITGEGALLLPEYLREDLAQPLGIVRSGSGIQTSLETHAHDMVITIGDLTTKTVLDAGITPKLMIIDNKVHRNAYTELSPMLSERNFPRKTLASGPGFISREASLLIREALLPSNAQSLVLEVVGEDDLLTLPAVMEAPIGAVVYYGQPPMEQWACGPSVEGIVEVLITPEIQKTAQELLDKFIPERAAHVAPAS